MIPYTLSVWLHLIAACVWVGSMVFFAVVIVPLLRRPELRAQAPLLVRLVGARFRALGWAALAALGLTGAVNLHYRAVTWTALTSAEFWSIGFGRVLAYKLALIALVLIITSAHGRLAGGAVNPGAAPSPAQLEQSRQRASYLGRAVLLLSLAILLCAVALVRGSFG